MDANGKYIGRMLFHAEQVVVQLNNEPVAVFVTYHPLDWLPDAYASRGVQFNANRTIYFASADCTGVPYTPDFSLGLRTGAYYTSEGSFYIYVGTGPYATRTMNSMLHNVGHSFGVFLFTCSQTQFTTYVQELTPIDITGIWTLPFRVQ